MQKPGARILGLDIGVKFTGVALSDENRLLSSPYVTIEAVGRKKWMREIGKVLRRSEAGEIVVGMPLEKSAHTEKIERYVALLRERFEMPVVEWADLAASIQIERKAPAATVLQSYLDSLRADSEERENG